MSIVFELAKFPPEMEETVYDRVSYVVRFASASYETVVSLVLLKNGGKKHEEQIAHVFLAEPDVYMQTSNGCGTKK